MVQRPATREAILGMIQEVLTPEDDSFQKMEG